MSILDQIPDEILVDIFANLDYLTLHFKVRAVCKRFDAIIKSEKVGRLGEALFRRKDAKSEKLKSADEKIDYCFDVHPVFRYLVGRYELYEEEPGLDGTRKLQFHEVGFLGSGNAKKFIPLDQWLLKDERAISSRGIPATTVWNSHEASGKNLLFAKIVGPNSGNITVAELARAMASPEALKENAVNHFIKELGGDKKFSKIRHHGYIRLDQIYRKSRLWERTYMDNTYNYQFAILRDENPPKDIQLVFGSWPKMNLRAGNFWSRLSIRD